MRIGKIGPSLAELVSCRLAWDRSTLDFYSRDASPHILRPMVVAFPTNEKEIVSILRFASKNKIPVTPRGGGTGLVGGALGRGIILDMRNFRKITVRRQTVEAGSGVFKGQLDKELGRHGLFLGPNPSIGPFCTVGGMIGTNASGSRSLKYGSIVDNLISVRIVTSGGRIVNLPWKGIQAKKFFRVLDTSIGEQFPKVSKNSCGYRVEKVSSVSDSHKIIAGSEGTLGIIVSAKLKVIRKPRKVVLMIASYRALRDALEDIPRLLTIGPSALEIIDHNIVSHIGNGWPKGKNALLFIEFDDNTSKKRKGVLRLIPDRIVRSTSRTSEVRKWWTHRNAALSYSLRSISRNEVLLSLMEDATVPVHRLPLLLDLAEHLKSRYHLRLIIYGHAGNGNLHIRPILKKSESHLAHRIATEFFYGVISIGGTITGEHGDGLSRTKFVRFQYGKDAYSLFRLVKEFFDPSNTLNPGKIILSSH